MTTLAPSQSPGVRSAPETRVTSADPGLIGVSYLVVYFFAGLAPQQIAAVLAEAARRLLKSPTPEALASRVIPLSSVRGIGRDVEERLAEEGILDTTALAMADPLKLMRATAFDKRQLLGWIDEALLIVSLPKHWQALEDVGVSGAIDLAWCAVHQDTLAKVAQSVSVDVDLLSAVATRLSEDMQVVIVWALYQAASEGDGPDDFTFLQAAPQGEAGPTKDA